MSQVWTSTSSTSSATPVVSELLSFGHSLTTGFGGSSAEFSWPARFAKAIDCELEVYGQNGAMLAYEDSSSTSDGGIMTVFKRLQPSRTAAPYLSGWGAVSLHYGGNDIHNFGTGNSVREAFKGALRAAIGISRTSRWYQDNNVAITKGGAHSQLTGSADIVPNGRFDYIAAVNGSANYWELAVPADFPGGAIWAFVMAQSGNGALANVTVDGGTPTSINGTTGATTIDWRGQGLAAINNVVAYRIAIPASGAHTVRITPTTINGGFAVFSGFGIEAEVPPWVIVLKQYKLASYSSLSGVPFPPDDTAYATLSTWIGDVVAENSDGKVISVDTDSAINKQSRYLYSVDGLHLNDEGAEVVAGAALDAMRSASQTSGRSIMASAKKGSIAIARQAVKRPCRLASTANVNLASAPTTLDGVTLAFADRLLIKNQTAPAENGIYRWLGAVRPLERDTDADSAEELFPGVEVSVTEGTTQNKSTKWILANTGTITVGTTAIRWARTTPDIMPQPQRSFWTPGSNSIETFPGGQTTAGLAALLSGRLSLVGGIVLPAGQTITTITFLSGTTAAVTPTNQLFALYRQSDLVRLGVTADDTTTAWAATATKTLTLTSTYTPDQDLPVYVGIMVAAATVPNLTGANILVQSSAIPPIKHASADTGLTTTLPATAGALTAQAGLPYAYLA